MRLVESSNELQTKVDDVDEIKSLHRLVRACTYSSRSVVNLYASNRVSFFNPLIICRTIAIGNKPPSQNRIAAAAAIGINAHDRPNKKSCRRLLMQQLSHTELNVPHVHIGTFFKDQPNNRSEKFKNNSRQAIIGYMLLRICLGLAAWAWLVCTVYMYIYTNTKYDDSFYRLTTSHIPCQSLKLRLQSGTLPACGLPGPCVYKYVVLVGMRACKRR